MTRVVIYNAGGQQVLGEVTLKHAIGMFHRKVARAKEWVEGATFGPYPKVTAVELVNYVFTKWVYQRTGKVVFSRANLMERDRYKCGYCDRRATTMDHIVPRCQGGQSEWTNCIAACRKCNSDKGGRTPQQAGMRLLWEPFTPKRLAEVRPGR